MPKRFSDSEIWTKDWFLDLSIKQKLLLKFLFDNCDCAGIYEISYRTLKNCFNEEITKEDFKGLKQVKFIDENTIFIEDFIKFQYNTEIKDLNSKYSVHKGIIKKLNKYNIFERVAQGLDNSTLEELQVKVMVKDKDKVNISSSELKEEKENKKEKEENLSLENWYGFYKNVHLTSNQYGRLLSEIANQSALDEIIEDLSSNIAQKKEKSPPYDENFPDMHFATLKAYWKYRKLNGFKKPIPKEDKARAFKEELDRLTEHFRQQELNSG